MRGPRRFRCFFSLPLGSMSAATLAGPPWRTKRKAPAATRQSPTTAAPRTINVISERPRSTASLFFFFGGRRDRGRRRRDDQRDRRGGEAVERRRFVDADRLERDGRGRAAAAASAISVSRNSPLDTAAESEVVMSSRIATPPSVTAAASCLTIIV